MKTCFSATMIAFTLAGFTSAQAQSAPQAGSAQETAPATTDRSSPIMSLNELQETRGGNQIAINQQILDAETHGNTINGDFAAGDVSLSDDAFSGFNGLGNFVFNTGAQSSLQAGMSVTINIQD